jgi:hypothetical protein
LPTRASRWPGFGHALARAAPNARGARRA